MNEPVKFKRLKEIASELHQKMEQLHLGELSRKELEQLTDVSRELYERLVVLRFKAYNDEAKPASQSEATSANVSTDLPVKQEESPVIPSISFRMEEPKAEPVQVSLIDAIEEVSKTTSAAKETVAPKEGHPAELASPVLVQQEVFAPRESLHEKLSKTITNKETIAQRLEHNPIGDLKRAISLNQRFQFSKELFKGNNQDYEVAIDKLNNSSREDALKHLESLRSKYAWNNESPVALDFADLVERRHQ